MSKIDDIDIFAGGLADRATSLRNLPGDNRTAEEKRKPLIDAATRAAVLVPGLIGDIPNLIYDAGKYIASAEKIKEYEHPMLLGGPYQATKIAGIERKSYESVPYVDRPMTMDYLQTKIGGDPESGASLVVDLLSILFQPENVFKLAATVPAIIKGSRTKSKLKQAGYNADEPVFHGSSKKFVDNEFDEKKIGSANDMGYYGSGFYFTPNSGEASYYGPQVGKFYLKGKFFDLEGKNMKSVQGEVVPIKEPGSSISNRFRGTRVSNFMEWAPLIESINALDTRHTFKLRNMEIIRDYINKNAKIVKIGDHKSLADGKIYPMGKMATLSKEQQAELASLLDHKPLMKTDTTPYYSGNPRQKKRSEEKAKKITDNYRKEIQGYNEYYTPFPRVEVFYDNLPKNPVKKQAEIDSIANNHLYDEELAKEHMFQHFADKLQPISVDGYIMGPYGSENFTNAVKKAGFDGIKYGDERVVFSSNQIIKADIDDIEKGEQAYIRPGRNAKEEIERANEERQYQLALARERLKLDYEGQDFGRIQKRIADILSKGPEGQAPTGTLSQLGLDLDKVRIWRNSRVRPDMSSPADLEAAAFQLSDANIPREQRVANFKKVLRENYPDTKISTEDAIKMIDNMPSIKEVAAAIGKKADNKFILGWNDNLKTGDPLEVRLDIPSFRFYNTWVVALHEPKKGKTVGDVLGYGSTAYMKNVTTKNESLQKSYEIMTGARDKYPVSVLKGEWVDHDPTDLANFAKQVLEDPKSGWKQIGFNPKKSLEFYDRDTLDPVIGMESYIQIGNLVLAKNPRSRKFMSKNFVIEEIGKSGRKPGVPEIPPGTEIPYSEGGPVIDIFKQ